MELLALVSLIGGVVVLAFLRAFTAAVEEAQRVEEVRAGMIRRQRASSQRTDGMTRVWTSAPPVDRS